ncbi:MAG: alpha/beta hydrolase [Gemmatimonadota bacterium]
MRTTVLSVCLVALGGCAGTALGPGVTTDEGFFFSGSIRLSYAIDIPKAGSGPFPLVVFGHDSSPEDKNRRKDWARKLVDNGIAVFRFDKRGVGDSDGVYRRGFADFELLSGDLIAAVDFVLQDSRIDPTQIGLMGSSQAGWLIPMVASRSPHVAFTIGLSAPAVTVAEHNFWADKAENDDLTISQLSALLADFQRPPGDFDPRPFIEDMTTPGLWILGDKDRIIPARESAAIIREVAEGSGKSFTVVVYPDVGHGLRTVDGNDRIDFWADILPWLEPVIR